MPSSTFSLGYRLGLLIGAGFLCSACATTAPQPDASALRARAALSMLQTHPELANRAPLAFAEAEQAVIAAESPVDGDEARHLGYLAERRVEIAQNRASERLSEEQLKALSEERDRMQVAMNARRHQAELARLETASRTPVRQPAFFLPPGPAPGTPVAAAAPSGPVAIGKTRYYCTTSNNQYYCLTN